MNSSSTAALLVSKSKSASGEVVVGNVLVLVFGSDGTSFVLEIADDKTCIINAAFTLGLYSK